jgi:hypothetical protein
MPKTTVTVTEYTDQTGRDRVQYRTTIPKSLAEAFGLANGETIDWSVQSGSACRIKFNDD